MSLAAIVRDVLRKRPPQRPLTEAEVEVTKAMIWKAFDDSMQNARRHEGDGRSSRDDGIIKSERVLPGIYVPGFDARPHRYRDSSESEVAGE